MGKRKKQAKDEEEELYEEEEEAPAPKKKAGVATRSSSRRSSTRASAAATKKTNTTANKRRKVVPAEEEEEEEEAVVVTPSKKATSPRAASPARSPATSEAEVEQLPFKNMAKSKWAEYQAAGRRPVFKNIKQILKQEPTARDLPPGVQSYHSINAPPSLVPAKKYCDLTGFEAPYTDPRTGLRYASAAVFQYLQTLPYDYVQRFLALRNAASKLR